MESFHACLRRFGVDDDELENVPPGGNEKTALLKKVTENKNPEKKPETQAKKKRKYYLNDKKIYAFMFVYDVTRPHTLEDVMAALWIVSH